MRARPEPPRLVRSLTGVFVTLWLVLPLVPLGIWSFARGWRFPDILPQEWTLNAWSYALSDRSGLPAAFGSSLAVAAIVTLISLLIGLPAGRALGLHQFRGKRAAEMIILAPIIVPGIAVALGLHSVFLLLGLTGIISGVILVHLVPTLPYMILVISGIFANFNPSFEAQARSLGASPLQVLWHVTLPAILPGVVVASLFTFLVSWSQYALTLMIGSGRVVTLPLLLFNFAAAGRNDLTGAIAMIYILPGLAVLVLAARYIKGRSAALGVPAT